MATVLSGTRRRLDGVAAARPAWWVHPLAAAVALAVVAHGPRHEVGGPRSLAGIVHDAGDAAVMAVAMMLPLVVPAARLAGAGALWSRRRATVAWYVAGFVAVWGLCAFAGSAVLYSLGLPGTGAVWVALAALVALVWQTSTTRRRAMARCGLSAPLAARGWPAARRTTASGARHGARCVYTCWASMLVMVVTPHPAMMGTLFAIHAYERRPGPNPFAERRWQAPAVAYAVIAAAALATAAVP